MPGYKRAPSSHWKPRGEYRKGVGNLLEKGVKTKQDKQIGRTVWSRLYVTCTHAGKKKMTERICLQVVQWKVIFPSSILVDIW